MANILGDINPVDPKRPADPDRTRDDIDEQNNEEEGSMVGGSQHDRTKHPGSRSVTEGTTGGTGTEVGGTRNYRTGTGATGGDIGNRPE
jgi:hypothetical protein